MRKSRLLLLCLAISAGTSGHQRLPEPLLVPYILRDVEYGSLDFGDYDVDGDLDLLLSGISGERPVTRVYRLDDSVFTLGSGENVEVHLFKTFRDADAILPQVWQGAARWGDYDGDTDLDIILSGLAIVEEEVDTDIVEIFTEVYENRSGVFVKDVDIVLPQVYNGPLAWGDYDADGDLDVLVAGATSQEAPYAPVTRLFRNEGGRLLETHAAFPGLMLGDAGWADMDGDGDLDLALLGQTDGTAVTDIWRNEGGDSFTKIDVDLPRLTFGSLSWADYDGDGDPDLAVTGGGIDPRLFAGEVLVLRNDGDEQFVDVSANITDVGFGSIEWADFDGDEDLDLAVIGRRAALGGESGWIYLNEGSDRFIPDIRLAGMAFSGMAVGDYNGDGDPDLVMSGRRIDGRPSTNFFMNRVDAEPLPADLFPR